MSISYINPYPGGGNIGIKPPDQDENILKQPEIIMSLKEINDYVEIAFNVLKKGNAITQYEIWSSYDNSDYKLLRIIPVDKYNRNRTSFTIKDRSYDRKTTIYYKIYALNNGLRYDPAMSFIKLKNEVPDPKYIVIEPMTEMFNIQYEVPDDRRLSHIEVYHNSALLKDDLSFDNANLIYKGKDSNILYVIKDNERDHYHQFWVKSITRV